jgi:hypothetical protein
MSFGSRATQAKTLKRKHPAPSDLFTSASFLCGKPRVRVRTRTQGIKIMLRADWAQALLRDIGAET